MPMEPIRNALNRKSTKWALRIANHYGSTKNIMHKGLGFVSILQTVFGNSLFLFITNSFRKLSFNRIPAWNKYMPQPARYKRIQTKTRPDLPHKVVYFPSCISQTMGPSKGDNHQDSLVKVTINVLEKAGYEVIFPGQMDKLCCGTPWESKGFSDIADAKSAELEMELLKASENGKYPVLCDTSPCIYRMRRVMSTQLKMYEPVEFIHDFLLDKLSINKTNEKAAFHITCSSIKMDLNEKFLKVAQACTDAFVFPEEVGCCGFAGDKGFSQPAMNDWALRNLKVQVQDCESGYSNSRTCEIGLSKNSGINYRSVMYLIDQAAE